MNLTNLEDKVRLLAHLLAYEEEAQTRASEWYTRKREHDFLLNKLYRLQKKT